MRVEWKPRRAAIEVVEDARTAARENILLDQFGVCQLVLGGYLE